MVERVMALLASLCSPTESDEVLMLLCDNACRLLDGLLADGVKAEDCQEAYRLAAAWLAMDWLKSGRNWEGVTSLSAGDLTVRRESAGERESLSHRAMELMRPYLRDRGFVFRGVGG